MSPQRWPDVLHDLHCVTGDGAVLLFDYRDRLNEWSPFGYHRWGNLIAAVVDLRPGSTLRRKLAATVRGLAVQRAMPEQSRVRPPTVGAMFPAVGVKWNTASAGDWLAECRLTGNVSVAAILDDPTSSGFPDDSTVSVEWAAGRSGVGLAVSLRLTGWPARDWFQVGYYAPDQLTAYTDRLESRP